VGFGLASKIGLAVAEGEGLGPNLWGGPLIGCLRGVAEGVGVGNPIGCELIGCPRGGVGAGVGVEFGPALFGGGLCPVAPAPTLAW